MPDWSNPQPYWLRNQVQADPLLPLRAEQARNQIRLQGLEMGHALLQTQAEKQQIEQRAAEFPLRIKGLEVQSALKEREMADELNDANEVEKWASSPDTYVPKFRVPKNRFDFMQKQINEKGAEARLIQQERMVEQMKSKAELDAEKTKLQHETDAQKLEIMREQLEALKQWRTEQMTKASEERASRERIAAGKEKGATERAKMKVKDPNVERLSDLELRLSVTSDKKAKAAIEQEIKTLRNKVKSDSSTSDDEESDETTTDAPVVPTMKWVRDANGRLVPSK